MFEEKVDEALWAIEVAAGKKKAENANDLARLVVNSTKILQLYEISEKLNGWAKYVFDKSNAVLGNNAVYKLRAARKDALMKLSSLGTNELKAIKESLREDFVGLRIFDFEPEVRLTYYKLFNSIISETDMKHFRIALTSPAPITFLTSDIGYMIVALDRIHLPESFVSEFENEGDAYAFFSNIITLMLYAKQKKLLDAEQISTDKFASKYAKECYKILTKSSKNETNINIAELIREGNLWDAVGELQMKENFYNAFKYMWNITLVSFGFGEMKFTSFVSESTFTIDKYGLERMADAFEKNKNASREYFTAMFLLNSAIQDYFFDKRIYLSRELEPVLPSDMGWAFPLTIKAECTADWKPVVPLNNIPASCFGIKSIRIDTADNKFFYLAKAPEDFKIDPVNGSIAKAELYSVANADFVKGGYFFIPEFSTALLTIAINRRIDQDVVNQLNLNPTFRKFSFVSEDGKNGIAGYFSSYIKTREVEGRMKK